MGGNLNFHARPDGGLAASQTVERYDRKAVGIRPPEEGAAYLPHLTSECWRWSRRREGTPMVVRIVADDSSCVEFRSILDEIVHEGTLRMLTDRSTRSGGRRPRRGRQRVPRRQRACARYPQRRARERTVMTEAGALKGPILQGQRPPRRRGVRRAHRVTSEILPAHVRRSTKISNLAPPALPAGLSTGDFAPALEEFPAPIRACPRSLSPGWPRHGRPSASSS